MSVVERSDLAVSDLWESDDKVETGPGFDYMLIVAAAAVTEQRIISLNGRLKSW